MREKNFKACILVGSSAYIAAECAVGKPTYAPCSAFINFKLMRVKIFLKYINVLIAETRFLLKKSKLTSGTMINSNRLC